ncbi:MAG: hypothetical protein AMXMBFR48_25040 [Ignavibacteriales bacterium]
MRKFSSSSDYSHPVRMGQPGYSLNSNKTGGGVGSAVLERSDLVHQTKFSKKTQKIRKTFVSSSLREYENTKTWRMELRWAELQE